MRRTERNQTLDFKHECHWEDAWKLTGRRLIYTLFPNTLMYPISGRNQEYVNIYLGWIRCKQNDYGEDVAKNGSIMCKTGHWQEQAFEFRYGWIF